jgi:hypothetical protein
MYRDLMEKNGIVPITEEAWGPVELEYDRFAMLGVPIERCEASEVQSDVKGAKLYHVSRDLLQIGVKRLTDVPERMFRTVPCLYGQIGDPLLIDDEIMLKSIAGMSGCPVYGFKDNKYWVVGMQSHWYDKSHQTRAVAVWNFAMSLQENIATILAYDENSAEDSEKEP